MQVSTPANTDERRHDDLDPEALDEAFAGPSLALYTFQPENANELALSEGQIIQVGYRHGQGWLVAMDLETGEQGLVPEEYVRLLRDIEGWGEEDDEDGAAGEDTSGLEEESSRSVAGDHVAGTTKGEENDLVRRSKDETKP